MKRKHEPKLSVVLATKDNFSSIEKTVEYLRRQTVPEQIELVVVCPHLPTLQAPVEDLECFGAFQSVELQPFLSIGCANAAGVRKASAPVVALAEDHAFMEPEWAEELLKSHADPHVAVGPAVENPNPQTWVSRADFFLGYGPWEAPRETETLTYLPGHNTSYKREALLELGSELEHYLNAETLLHWKFHGEGKSLLLNSRARIHHVNFSLLSVWLKVLFHNGRNFAGMRRQEMSATRRVIYVAGGLLIPLVRYYRIWSSAASPAGVAREAPGLLFGLLVDALGQMVGYALGPGDSRDKLLRYEFRRVDNVRREERELFSIQEK